MKRYKKPSCHHPRIVSIADVRGDELHRPRPRLVNELLAMDDAEALEQIRENAARRDWIAHAEIRDEQTMDEAVRNICRYPLPSGNLPDPFAQDIWAAISNELSAPMLGFWERAKLPVAFTIWSIACFCLGRLI